MAAIGLGTAVNAQGAPGIDVMVLGTYHFDSPGLDLNNPAVDDVLKPQRQVELEALAAAIAEFRPTKVMVERVSADLIDPKYPVQQVAKPGDRVLVVYGSGHNYWLRHFAMTAAGYRNVDPTPYLERAAAAR
jgi:hypothetical protein